MNCIIGQSGGPTSVINSTLAGVISAAIDKDFKKIYGSLHGIEGIIENDIVEIDKKKYRDLRGDDRLMRRPSSLLGSCRYKLPDDLTDPIYRKIFDRLEELEISSFIYIGGNDSMDTVMKLNDYMDANKIEGINIIGGPKTIDNDLCEMDHSPGFGSAAKFVASTLKTIRTDVDIYDLQSVTIVEIMGRNAGWLAASGLLANMHARKDVANLIYLGEMEKTKEDLVREVKEALEKENNLIVIMSEGFMDKDKYFENMDMQVHDQGFNHPIISGIASRISDYLHDQLGVKTRAIEFNIVQRTNQLISRTDAEEAFKLGYQALELSLIKTNLVPIVRRLDREAYEVYFDAVEPSSIANKEKVIPKEWLEDKKTLEENIITYAGPLIVGEMEQEYKDGMPYFIELEDIIVRG